jgi:nucleoside-diphosphate-sugar epimerase
LSKSIINGEDTLHRILIIGASGYIGTRLSYLLAMDGHLVTALCYPTKPIDKEWNAMMEEVIVGDITSYTTLDKLTDNYFDLAMQLVSLDNDASNGLPDFVCSTNVIPVWNILRLFNEKKNLPRLIYFSTIHVYGAFPSTKISESQMTIPTNPYGLTHLLAENVCNMFNANSDIKCLNIRLSNSYGSPLLGDKNCWSLVVNDLCRSVFERGEIELKSDGSALRDFIHYSDIYSAISLLIRSDWQGAEHTYNLSSGITYSILELAKIVKDAYMSRFDAPADIIFTGSTQTESKFTHDRYVIDNRKLLDLGFHQSIDINGGVNELFDYMESSNE